MRARQTRNEPRVSCRFLIFLLYPSTSALIFSAFICEDIDDGQSYLRADYAINCASPEHTLATSFATLMLFVYPVGVRRPRIKHGMPPSCRLVY